MKKKEVIKLYKTFKEVDKYPGVNFAYAIAKNIKLVDGEIASLEAAERPTKEFIDLENKRMEIARKFCKKDQQNKFIIVDNNFTFDVDNRILFEQEYSKLKEENEELIAARKQQLEEYGKILEEDISFAFFKIKKSYLPQVITGEQTTILWDIIDHTEEKK